MENAKLSDAQLLALEEIYKAFSNKPRLRILIHLGQCNDGKCEHTVSQLSQVAGISQSATSHQLRELKEKRIIKSRKDGLNVFYSLHDRHIYKILENGLNHIKGANCNE